MYGDREQTKKSIGGLLVERCLKELGNFEVTDSVDWNEEAQNRMIETTRRLKTFKLQQQTDEVLLNLSLIHI